MAFDSVLSRGNDFVPPLLEICVPQRKKRIQLQKFIRLYTLFKNNDQVTGSICPISPSNSTIFWQTRSN